MTQHKTAKQIEEDLARQNSQVYGDEERGGHMESPDADDDVEEPMAKTLGDDAVIEAVDKRKPFNLADEMNEDERGAGGHISEAESQELRKEDNQKKQK